MLDFISYNRFNSFLDRLVAVRTTVTSTSYVDNSPNDLFTGPVGTILQKRGHIFSYKYPGDSDFTTINHANNSLEKLCKKYEVLLGAGVNKNATWVKLDASPGKKWANRGSKVQDCVICEIFVCPPPPTPTPYPYYYFDYLQAGTLRVKKLIVNGAGDCPPTSPGTFGQIVVCENYIYIYDGPRWKRFELSTYY